MQKTLLQKDEMFCVWKKDTGFQHIVLKEKSIEKKYSGANYEHQLKANYKKNNKFSAWSQKIIPISLKRDTYFVMGGFDKKT